MFGTDIIRDDAHITLSGIIWSRYGDKNRRSLYCPHICKELVCGCPILLISNPDMLTRLKTYEVDVLT